MTDVRIYTVYDKTELVLTREYENWELRRRSTKSKPPKWKFPLGLNNAYTNVPGRGRVLLPHGRRYKKHIVDWLDANDQYYYEGSKPLYDFYNVKYIFLLPYNELYYKNGELRSLDTGNLTKLIEDALFEYLGLLTDDKEVFSISGDKRPTTGTKRVVILVDDLVFDDEPCWFGPRRITKGLWEDDEKLRRHFGEGL